jgi:CcmD family protein
MLVTAYSLFWLLLLVFVWMTWRRQQKLTSRLRQLESQLAKLNAGDLK